MISHLFFLLIAFIVVLDRLLCSTAGPAGGLGGLLFLWRRTRPTGTRRSTALRSGSFLRRNLVTWRSSLTLFQRRLGRRDWQSIIREQVELKSSLPFVFSAPAAHRTNLRIQRCFRCPKVHRRRNRVCTSNLLSAGRVGPWRSSGKSILSVSGN